MTCLLPRGNKKLNKKTKKKGSKKTICKKVPCQKKKLLEILRSTNFPLNESRKNVMKKGQVSYEGFVLGMINLFPYWANIKGHKQELSVRTKDPKFKELYNNTRLLLKLHDPNFKYTTIQYNKNHRCAKHKDGRNVGESYIIGLGDYTGGELMVWDENDKNPKKHNIRNKFYKFNGSQYFHETQPFKGERYTMVYFNI
jgi:hypothetical protein